MFGFQLQEEPVPLGKYLHDGDIITFGHTKLEAIHVPGHSPGSLVYYCKEDNCMFSGDVLFQGSIGRADLTGGKAALRTQAKTVERDILFCLMDAGDYKAFPYPDGAVVIDNPPFSILASICTFYLKHGIPFFLFAPLLTCFSGRKVFKQMNHIIVDCQITYENDARVKTSFVTSYSGGIVAQTSPDLTKAINRENDRLIKANTKELQKYDYPMNVITAAIMQRYQDTG